jgi:hypothetical protein
MNHTSRIRLHTYLSEALPQHGVPATHTLSFRTSVEAAMQTAPI